MNGTPRMRSSYPSTPGSAQQNPNTTQDGSRVRSPLPNLPDGSPAAPSSSSPVIPVHLVDAPSQRMYTFAVYGLLIVWRIYDWWQLVEEDATSIGLFLKWGVIDLVFLFGVPLLRIPWLEWSETTSLAACCVHAILNGILMFRIPVSYLDGRSMLDCADCCLAPY
jgi:nucleoporin POM152